MHIRTIVSRSELQRKLSRSELDEMGPAVYRALENDFNVSCNVTGTILGSNKLSVEILNFRNDVIENKVFSGAGWKNVGEQITVFYFAD